MVCLGHKAALEMAAAADVLANPEGFSAH